MNTRLQVEHPVTEEITGLDLVEWQFRVAAGEPLPLKQPDIKMTGHAIEVRLCAEDPSNGFMPSVGKIHKFTASKIDGVRVETGVESGSEVSPFYDSMIAKLIVHRASRHAAIEALKLATLSAHVFGPPTNQTFLARLLTSRAVIDGNMDTGMIGRELEQLSKPANNRTALECAIPAWIIRTSYAESRVDGSTPQTPWTLMDAFQIGPARKQRIAIDVNGVRSELDIAWQTSAPSIVGSEYADDELGGKYGSHSTEHGTSYVIWDGTQTILSKPTYDASDLDSGAATGAVKAPINGRVAKVFVALGAKVAKGDKIAVVEAMKMEHVISAAIDGTVDKLGAAEGAQVTQGALIAHIAAASG
jgi:3-methylcrotonyl-CoA carboxylase alpha subunit